MSTPGYLDRMLDPVTQMMPVDFARKLVEMRADDNLVQRIEYLRRQANRGLLTPEEDAEYKEAIDAIDLISLLQAKAQSVLSDQTS